MKAPFFVEPIIAAVTSAASFIVVWPVFGYYTLNSFLPDPMEFNIFAVF